MCCARKASFSIEKGGKAMPYVYSRPAQPSFRDRGLSGYEFGPLKQNDLDIYYVEVETGHDTFMVSRKIARTYYVLSGTGYFIIEGLAHPVGPGMLAEIPPGVEYSYSGKMKLIVFSRPRWFVGNDRLTKWNPDVVVGERASPARNRPWLRRLIQLRVFGKSPAGVYLRLNQQIWDRLSVRAASAESLRAYGRFLHRLARAQGNRAQAGSTFFLRNRPQLELIQRLARRHPKSHILKVAVLGCSSGAEVYSVAWAIRSETPDRNLLLHAVDISSQAVEAGKDGTYLRGPSHAGEASIFERMSDWEIEQIFEPDGNRMTIKAWLREGIEWHVGDAGEAELKDLLGLHDIVLANNFLCHMDGSAAGSYLRSISRLVAPGGYLVVSGVDLEVRTKLSEELGWHPVQELLEEIHDGDPCLRRLWPCHYSGLEPFDKTRNDWMRRYASAFQVNVPVGRDECLAAKELVA